MSDIFIRLGHHAVAITCPEHLFSDGILSSLRSGLPATAAADERVVVSEAADRSFTLQITDRHPEAGLKRGALLKRLLDFLALTFLENARVPVLGAAAVGRGDGALLIAGPEACGKSSLAAFLIEKGFSFIADNQIAVIDDSGSLEGLPAPFSFAAMGTQHLVALQDFASAPMARAGERIHIGIKDSWRAKAGALPARMMIFPRYVRDARAGVEVLETAAAACLLKAQLRSIHGGGDEDLWHIRMARDIPAVLLRYSSYDDIDGLIDRLARLTIEDRLSPRAFTRFVSGIGRPVAKPSRQFPIPERSGRQFSPFMTIGMATYDDYDGVYFSLQAIRLYHPEILDEVEFLIIDNHPQGPCSAALKGLEKHIANLRYVPAADVTGTAVRSRLFNEAGGAFVLCMDCHVLFAPGSLRKLIDYFRAWPASNDLVQGPMIRDDLKSQHTHWSPHWRSGMFGTWASDPAGEDPANPPFEIALQGLGVFACWREAWPGFNPAFRGFGGEEGYIHEKFRQAGGRVLCLPALRWLHRFERPLGPSYPLKWEDRIRNYMIGFREIGWDTGELEAHFHEKLGRREAERIFARVRKELDGAAGLEIQEPADVDVPYDLGVARLSFVAERAVPILLARFTVPSALCIGRGAPLWTREFARHGIEATSIDDFAAIQPDAESHSSGLACCFEMDGISSAALAEELVLRLTTLAPVVAFLSAEPARDDERLGAFWTALFAKRGYQAIDCLRPVLKGDPRIGAHYQRNIAVFRRQAVQNKGAAEGVGKRPRAPRSKIAEPGVSVILPVHNGAAYLGQAIESILLQTHRKLELVIVDDGSTDGSGTIADDYAKADPRVRVIHQENGGEAAAANAGYAAARFALMARLDHDDVALPERLALQVAFLKRHEDIAAVGGAMRLIDSDGKPTGGKATYPLTPEACHAALQNATVAPIANPTAMMRKAAFKKIGGYRRQFRNASDLDLWLRMDERFKLANLSDLLVDYRTHGANMTSTQRFEQALHAQIARQAALLRRRGLPDPTQAVTKLDLETLAAFAMPEEERAQAYRALFEAALFNFGKSEDEKYLLLANRCLAMMPAFS
jgi:hypothetical protein